MLITVSACTAMRLAQGVLGGAGSIGAGTILEQGNIVRGVTAAATLWLSTVVGPCFGGGATHAGLPALLAEAGLATKSSALTRGRDGHGPRRTGSYPSRSEGWALSTLERVGAVDGVGRVEWEDLS